MSHRPYPNADRALKQVARRQPVAPVMSPPEWVKQMASSLAQLRMSTRQAAKLGFGVDTYRLSTRHPAPAAPTGLRD